MYVILKHGGKQYKVSPGDEVVLEKIDADAGANIDLGKIGRVLFLSDDGEINAEAGELKDLKIAAKIVEHFQGDKVIAFKYKSKKDYRRKKGHRQHLTRVLIETIGDKGVKADSKTEKKVAEKPKAVKKAAVSESKAKEEKEAVEA